MMHYFVGLDLGQASDYTAAVVVEQPLWIDEYVRDRYVAFENNGDGWISPRSMTSFKAGQLLSINYKHGRPPYPPLRVRHLERFELGTPYPQIVERVADLYRSLRGPRVESRAGVETVVQPDGTRFVRPRTEGHHYRVSLIVDATGVGKPVVDSLRSRVPVHAVSIHGGDRVTSEGMDYRAPKRDLVGAAQVALQGGRLKIALGLPESETLRRELQNFRQTINPTTAHDSYSHFREGDHDDLVLAAALALWFQQRLSGPHERAFSRSRRYGRQAS